MNILKFTYEFNHNLLPSDLSNIFDYNSAIHKYKTRSATNQGLFIPEIFTSNYGTKSIKYQGPDSYGMIHVKTYLQLTMFTQWHLKI